MLSSMSVMAYAPTMAPVPTVARAAAPQAMDLGGLKEQATKLNPVVGTRSGSKRRPRSEAPQLPRPGLHRLVGSLGRCGGSPHPNPSPHPHPNPSPTPNVTGYYDPLGLSEKEFWGNTEEARALG